MFKITVFVFLLLSFSGCVGKAALEPEKSMAAVKIFEQEDALILYALRAEEAGDYVSSSVIFNTLYEQSHKKEYLYNSLQSTLTAGKSQEAIDKVNASTKDSLDDFILVRVKIIALVQLEKLDEAKELALRLVAKSELVDDYLLVNDIYLKEGKFDTAAKYLEGAYRQNYNEKLLDQLSIVLYVNLQRKKDAIALLETHTRVYGCSELTCARLLGFYSDQNNIEGVLSTYLRLYKINASQDIAKKIVQIYAYKKEYIKLMDFLETSKSDDGTLLEIYSNTKNYVKASLLADKLYAKTGEISYLGQSAIYQYESSENKNDKKMLDEVIQKFSEVIKQDDSALYLNYFGYILIDHDIDVAQGIVYVNRALKLEPESPYYLDSLAWGYYKLGACEKANKVIEKVVKLEGGAVEEVLQHLQAIKKCKIKKNKRQK